LSLHCCEVVVVMGRLWHEPACVSRWLTSGGRGPERGPNATTMACCALLGNAYPAGIPVLPSRGSPSPPSHGTPVRPGIVAAGEGDADPDDAAGDRVVGLGGAELDCWDEGAVVGHAWCPAP
jgi:hypothetical protein